MTRSRWMTLIRQPTALLMWAVFAVTLSCSSGGGDGDGGTGPGTGTPGVTIDPNGLTIAVNGAGQLSASLRDSSGVVVPGATIAWSSLDDSIATVAPDGLVLGNAVGATSVIASAGVEADTVAIAVVAVADDSLSLEVVPHAATVNVGGTATFSVIIRNRSGTIVPTPPGVVWSTSNSAIGMVVMGVAAGVAPGQASIRASVGGIASAPAALNVNGTLRPCDNVAMTPIWRIFLRAEYTADVINDQNEHVVVQHGFRVNALLQPVGGVLPASEWEGPLKKYVVQNDRLTDLDVTPTATQTLLADGAPVVGNGRSVFRLTINEDDCTYGFSANPFVRATLTDPNAIPVTETADLPLAVVQDMGLLGDHWRNVLEQRNQNFSADWFGSTAAAIGIESYVPLGFGPRLWSSNNTDQPMGSAAVTYALYPYP